jgi:hypothetical protein
MNIDTGDGTKRGEAGSSPTRTSAAGGREPGEITQLLKIVEHEIESENVEDEVQVEMAIVLNLLAKMEKSGSVVGQQALFEDRPEVARLGSAETQLCPRFEIGVRVEFRDVRERPSEVDQEDR